MNYCFKCGTKNDVNATFCTDCGQKLNKNQTTKSGAHQAKSMPAYDSSGEIRDVRFQGQVPRRNYLLYLVAGFMPIFVIIVGGYLGLLQVYSIEDIIRLILVASIVSAFAAVVQLYYLYSNFSDYDKMIAKYHYNQYHPTQEPLLMLVIYLFFSPITIYFKYQQLHEHLEKIHHSKQSSPAPWLVLLLPVGLGLGGIILGVVGYFVVGVVGLLVIIPLTLVAGVSYPYFEHQWQEKFNEHVRFHESGQYNSKSELNSNYNY